MKTLKTLILAVIFAISSCAPLSPTDNPLDRPQTQLPTVEQMHYQNVAAITGDPTKNQTNEVD